MVKLGNRVAPMCLDSLQRASTLVVLVLIVTVIAGFCAMSVGLGCIGMVRDGLQQTADISQVSV